MFDDAFPPKDRIPGGEPLGGVRIEHADGITDFDHNGIVVFIATRVDEALALRPVPHLTSVLSGEPAVMYRADDFAIPLTVGEIAGLVGRELRPVEYVALRGRYGMFFEIHDDFYDPETGECLQPGGMRAGYSSVPGRSFGG